MPSHADFELDNRSKRFEAKPFCSARFDRWPLKQDRVIFMGANECCHACRLLQTVGVRKFADNLHVVLSANRLIVTEADNLHKPGRVLSGVKIADYARCSLFRLTAEPPPGVDPARHLPAAGMATMTWGGRVKRLQIVGIAEGITSCHDHLADAVEGN